MSHSDGTGGVRRSVLSCSNPPPTALCVSGGSARWAPEISQCQGNLAIPNLRICLVCDRLLCVLCLPERLLVGFQISAGDLSPPYAGRITESDQNLWLFFSEIDRFNFPPAAGHHRARPWPRAITDSHLQLQTHNSKRAAPVASLCGDCGASVPKGGPEASPSTLS